MENASLPSDEGSRFTTSSSGDDTLSLYLFHIRDLVLEVVHVIIGTVGVLDNLFVIITFALFIKITDKVLAIFNSYTFWHVTSVHTCQRCHATKF